MTQVVKTPLNKGEYSLQLSFQGTYNTQMHRFMTKQCTKSHNSGVWLHTSRQKMYNKHHEIKL